MSNICDLFKTLKYILAKTFVFLIIFHTAKYLLMMSKANGMPINILSEM